MRPIYFIVVILSCAFTACNTPASKQQEVLLNPALVKGKTFNHTDTSSNLTGLYFGNDSTMQPVYRVCFDTVFNWRYVIKNNKLYRFDLGDNGLIAKDSILILNDSTLTLRSFLPEFDNTVNFITTKPTAAN